MAEYVINKERIASLRRLGEELANYVSEIRYGTERMLWYVDDNMDLPGLDLQQLRDALGAISREIQDLEKPAEELSEKIMKIAEAYEELVCSLSDRWNQKRS